MTGGTGALGYVKYVYEATFKAGGTIVRGFGFGPKLSASDKKNNVNKIYGLGSQDSSIIVDGKFEGKGSIEWAVSNMWFWPAILGGAVGSPTGAGPYVWTPAIANALPSFAIENGFELGGTDYVTILKGCVADSLTLSMEVGNNPIIAKLDFVYADETSSTTSSWATAPTDTESAVFNFAMGKFELPAGTIIGETEKASLTIKRNASLYHGLGDRRATTHIEGKREYSVDISTLLQSTTLLEKFYANTGSATGPAAASTTEISSIVLGFSNDGWGAAAATSRRIVITLTGCKIDTYGAPMEVENGVMVSLGIECRSIAVVITNNSAVGVKPTDVP